jgi:hypothetical protein
VDDILKGANMAQIGDPIEIIEVVPVEVPIEEPVPV